MRNAGIEKVMAFILQQQAQSSTKIDSLAIAQERNEKRWERTEKDIRALLSIAEIHERKMGSQPEQIFSQSQQILSLGETTRSTDERLKALINIVERQISEGRNGKNG